MNMSVAVITGSAGLIGAEAARQFAGKGLTVVGVDNDMRRRFFGDDASTRWARNHLETTLPGYRHVDADIRDEDAMRQVFATYKRDIAVVIHTAAQPSHDWAARDPVTDFTVNANGTLNLLLMTRQYCPDAPFIFCSTNKVYGDTPNRLPLVELETRWELSPEHPYAEHGIDESMSIDASTHSLFGVSKAVSRSDGAGIRPLFRVKDGVLSRRLPDRPRPFWRDAAWLPVISDEMRGDRRSLSRAGLQGQAGARQHS